MQQQLAKMSKFKTILRILIPISILAITAGIVLSGDDIDDTVTENETSPPIIPLLPTLDITSTIENFPIRTHGVLRPHHKINVITQVSGIITKTSNNFKAGGRFTEGDFLFQIDQRDYKLALTKAKSEVASAEQKLIREQAESKLARSDWKKYGKGEPSSLTLRLPQMQEAQAILDAAHAEYKKTQLDLIRTTYKAPFDGAIKNVSADLGQFVSLNSSVLEIFSDQKFEINLPVSRRQLENLPVSKDGQIEGAVSFTDPQRGNDKKWLGKIIRLEKELLAGTNQYVLVAELLNPLTELNLPTSLLVGSFLNAEITSKNIPNLYKIPRSSLYLNDSVLTVDKLDFVTRKSVIIFKKHNNYIYVTADFSQNDRIITRPPEIFIEGMKIRTNSSGASDMLLSIKELKKEEERTDDRYLASGSKRKRGEINE